NKRSRNLILILIPVLLTQVFVTAHGAPDSKPPLCFIENQGQVDDQVVYYLQGLEQTLFFTPQSVTFALKNRDSAQPARWTIRLDFDGSACTVKPQGLDPQPGKFSYFKGQPAEWKTGIPAYGMLIYRDLWPGIDLVYTAGQNQLKYEFRVKPGADPDAIRLVYSGVNDLRLDEQGALNMSTPLRTVSDGAPFAYQMNGSERIECPLRFSHPQETGAGTYTVGFEVGRYDPEKTLILDPAIFVYCGYLGGISTDTGTAVAADAAGNTYVTGYTLSTETSFPVNVGPDLTSSTDWDVFVAKISADGTQILYCGYIGGDGDDRNPGIAVDDMGAAYIVGITNSDQSSFPVKVGPDLTINGNRDAFVAKVTPDGTDLEFCGYMGGPENEWGSYHCGVALDDMGHIYMTCITELFEPTRSMSSPPARAAANDYDVFYAKILSDGTGPIFQGAISGDDHDVPTDLAVDADQNIYITGRTFSSEVEGFPVTVGPDLTFNGSDTDAFVAKINADGKTLEYCGYIGGLWNDSAEGLAVDDEGHVYVAGDTLSPETSFPVVMGPDLTFNGLRDAFVAKVSADGSHLEYCGYIGGIKIDEANGIDVDAEGNAWILGDTISDESDFPVNGGPGVVHVGSEDLFVARVNEPGTGLDYFGYIGGFGSEFGYDLFLDKDGAIHITGRTASNGPMFPVVAGPDLTYNGGMDDAFVAKIIIAPGLTADASTLSATTGGTINFDLFAGSAKASKKYLLLGGVSGTQPGTPLPLGYVVLPLNWDVYTDFVASLLNTQFYTDFLGTLDSAGMGMAQLNAPALPGTAIGVKMVYAYCLNYPWHFASEPVEIEIVP
ncbi:MAG: hypothetical protein ABIK28_08480, partial [Planctomycetota bacterium]